MTPPVGTQLAVLDVAPRDPATRVSTSVPAAVPVPAGDAERLRDTARLALAGNTRRAYEADWRTFEAWCNRGGYTLLPAEPRTVALYLDARAAGGARASTIERALAGIGAVHRARGLTSPGRDPQVQLVLAGIRRRIGAARRGKAPLLLPDLVALVRGCPDTLRGVRDRALLVLCFHGAFRRGEICRLRAEELEISPARIVYRSTQPSKTRQEGAEVVRVFERMEDRLEICPVACLKAWLDRSGVKTGFVFRRLAQPLFDRALDVALSTRGDAVAAIVKRLGGLAGLDPATLGGHSLRAGFVTTARLGGASLDEVAAQTGHASLDQVRAYDRRSADLRPRFAGALARGGDEATKRGKRGGRT